MPSMSKIQIMGHVGKDPESKTGDTYELCKFSVAVSAYKKDDPPVWYKVVVFGKQAKFCQQYLKKGSAVYVDGRFEPSTWEDKDGAVRMDLNIGATDVKLLGSKGDSQEKQAPPAKQQKTDKEPDLDDDDPYKEDF